MKTGRRRGLAAFLALWLLALTGCGAPAAGPAPTARPAASAPPTAAPTAAPLTAADLTLEEKVGQLFLVRPDALDPARTPQQIEDPDAAGATALTDAMRATLARIPVGGVVLFGKNIADAGQLTAFTADLQAAGRVPLLLAVDEEGGAVARLANSGALDLPRYESAAAVGAEGPEAVRTMYRTIGGYLREYGFALDFAPVADVNTNPDNPVIGSRAFSADPQTAAACVRAAVEGLGEAGVLACLKHFPGHGDTAQDSHEEAAVTEKTLAALRSGEWAPFAAGIAAGAPLVMVGHITAPNALPPAESDRLAGFSATVLNDWLRGELGFEGLVVTDSLAMGAVARRYSSGEAALAALQAGADLLLMPADLEGAYTAVVQAVESGRWPESELDARVERILAAKRAAGLPV